MTTGTDKPVRVVYPIPATAAAHPAMLTPSPVPRLAAEAWPRMRWLSVLLWWVIGLGLCMAWDRAVWLLISSAGRPRLEWLEQAATWSGYWASVREAASLRASAIGTWLIGSLYAAVRSTGKIYPWIVLAIFVLFRAWTGTDRRAVSTAVRRAVLIVAGPAIAAGIAEALKLLVRRERPEPADGWYSFRLFRDGPFDAKNLGMSSSDAAIAFAGAMIVGAMYPRTRPIVWPIAVACALCRVLVGAHFLSDIYVAAAIAMGVFLLAARLDRSAGGGALVAGAASPA